MSQYFKVRHLYVLYTVMILHQSSVLCLQNGVALTPPMGWLSWERFQCNINCDRDPLNCISENLFISMADKLVSEGYKDAGYEYINIDDCWMSHRRDKKGDMVADPVRFPRGIRFLADYMHAKGLKLGIYQDYGVHTCMGYPGIIGHVEQDAKKFAEWGVDMIKLDGCYADWTKLAHGYQRFGQYLKKHFKKPVLYSCSWPYYEYREMLNPNFELISTHCNMWRTFHDIADNWQRIEQVIDFYGDNQEVLLSHTGPGRWSDPDMIMIGNFHLSLGQSRAQMAVWSMIPGPLLMSNDLRNISLESKAILLNKKVIAVNQDPLGKPGKRIYKDNNVEVWKRLIFSSQKGGDSFALLFLNRDKEKECVITTTTVELGLTSKYLVTDLFNDVVVGVIYSSFTVNVSPMDAAMFTFDFIG